MPARPEKETAVIATAPPVAATTAGQAAPGTPEARWRQVYRGEDAQIPVLRRWLAGLLPECGARDDVVTVAVELATNAVRHTASGQGGWFGVEVAWQRGAVRVMVADQGAPSSPRAVDGGDPLSDSGRGLHLVRGLSIRTGVVGDRRGRLVWADVPWAGDFAAGPPGLPDGHEAAVRDGQDLLARRHSGIPVWFGRATLQWWAVVGCNGDRRLVAAGSPEELSRLLDTIQELNAPQRPHWPPQTPWRHGLAAGATG